MWSFSDSRLCKRGRQRGIRGYCYRRVAIAATDPCNRNEMPTAKESALNALHAALVASQLYVYSKSIICIKYIRGEGLMFFVFFIILSGVMLLRKTWQNSGIGCKKLWHFFLQTYVYVYVITQKMQQFSAMVRVPFVLCFFFFSRQWIYVFFFSVY